MDPSQLRQRRADRSSTSSSSSSPQDQEDDNAKAKELLKPGKDIGFGAAFTALLVIRYFSASSNIVHDCDEVFNYWEPLHFLLYKSGFQTWEYSSEFALRSYLYLLIHAVVGAPAALLYGSGPGKVKVFYLIKLAFAVASAAADAALVASVSRKFGKRVASYALVLLCFTSGCYTASTTFLPSTFSMYMISLASAALLADKLDAAVAVAACGVLVGWPFSGLAVAPLVIYTLLNGRLVRVFTSGFIASAVLLVLSAATDRFFYGKWKLSILNLVLYNVVGGGDSILYGVEGPWFYLRNGLNNFNAALLLALVLPFLLFLVRRSTDRLLFLIVSPLYIWLGFMSLQPHKEERFLYPIYPLICIAAAAAIERLPDIVPSSVRPRSYYDFIYRVLKGLRPLILSFILVVSYSRTTSLLQGYSAPMQIYNYLPANVESTSTVCVGSEWHRFPSSFFLPSPNLQIKWVDDGFGGLMPFPFNSSLGGTAAAPDYFNGNNKASPTQFVRDCSFFYIIYGKTEISGVLWQLKDETECDYLVELVLNRPGVEYRGNDKTFWEVVAERFFLDNEKSPALHRAFFIPWAWQSKNTFAAYRLLKRKSTFDEDRFQP